MRRERISAATVALLFALPAAAQYATPTRVPITDTPKAAAMDQPPAEPIPPPPAQRPAPTPTIPIFAIGPSASTTVDGPGVRIIAAPPVEAAPAPAPPRPRQPAPAAGPPGAAYFLPAGVSPPPPVRPAPAPVTAAPAPAPPPAHPPRMIVAAPAPAQSAPAQPAPTQAAPARPAVTPAAAPLPAAALAGAMVASEAFYKAWLQVRTPGIPNAAQRTRLRPWLAPSLEVALVAAEQAEKDLREKTKGEAPPLIEGDMFASLAEGASDFTAQPCATRPPGAECPVQFSYTDPDTKQKIEWQDTVLLLRLNGTWRVHDIRFGGKFALGQTGTLSDFLRIITKEAKEAR